MGPTEALHLCAATLAGNGWGLVDAYLLHTSCLNAVAVPYN